MRQLRLFSTLKLRNDAVGQHLPEFDTPLVERIDIPDGALDKDLVLIERDQLTECLRCQLRRKDSIRRAVALEGAVRHLKRRDAFRCNFLGRLSERQGLGLGEEVSHQQIVVRWEWVQGLAETNEVTRDQLGPLVDELIKGMLAIGSGLSPDDGPGLVIHPPAF